METQIRRANASDLDALLALARRTISASYRPFLGDRAVDGFLGSGAADRYVREHVARCTVLVRGGRLVGCAVCQGDLIDLLLIDPSSQRQGLGTTLLAHTEARLFRRHAALRLESFAENARANAFYRARGWREAGRYRDPESGHDKIVFAKGAAPADRHPPASLACSHQ
jgi:ribosomal protein S18 acetylase RimI-like enzyme